MPVGELLSHMSSSEFTEWMAFHHKIEPIGDLRGDLRTGLLGSRLINLQMPPHATKVQPWDFVLRLEPKPQQTVGQMQMFFQGLAKAMEMEEQDRQKRATRRKTRTTQGRSHGKRNRRTQSRSQGPGGELQ